VAIGIEKLRPELLEKSDAELDRLAAEIEMARAEKARRAEAEKRAKLIDEAQGRVGRLIDDLKWLHDNGLLSEKLRAALTRADGHFNPATFIRVPRAEDVLPSSQPDRPVRRRRRRDPATGELLPLE
jgi:hypothetical protein